MVRKKKEKIKEIFESSFQEFENSKEEIIKEEFQIGQIFENEYPVELADWCPAHNCYIKDLGNQKYQIKELENIIQDSLKSDLRKLEKELASMDYIGVKIATGRATIEEYKEEIQKMNELAQKIKELRGSIQ